MLETASSSNIDGIDRISQTQEALLVWHAAVVASWEAKTKLADLPSEDPLVPATLGHLGVAA